MSVGGFGAIRGEVKDRKMIPDELTAYRMFRFRPRPSINKADVEWVSYMAGENVPFSPCLSAASFRSMVYDRPGSYLALCERDDTARINLYRALSSQPTEFLGQGAHIAPGENCTCGFWAYYTPEVVDTGCGFEWMALAAVKVWGDVVLGDKGVRAQQMEIVGLQPPKDLMDAPAEVMDAWTRLTAKLAVPYYWSKGELLRFHPPQDVSELLPKPPEPPVHPYPDMIEALRYTTRAMGPSWTTAVTTSNQLYWSASNPSPYTVSGYGSTTIYENRCCVCGYVLAATSVGQLDAALAEHILNNHPTGSTPTYHTGVL